MQNEKWYIIPKFPSYEINESLEVRHIKFRKIKKFYLCDGYLKTNVDCGRRFKPYLHQLVAGAFVPNPENKPEVHHIDEDKLNNHWSNLQWVTKKEHRKISKENGQIAFKLSPQDVVYVRDQYSFENEANLAAMFKVKRSTIYSIAIRLSRKDVDGGKVNEPKGICKRIINTETGKEYVSAFELAPILKMPVKELRRQLSGERYNKIPYRYIVDGIIQDDVKFAPIKPPKLEKIKFIRPPKKQYVPHPLPTKKLFMYKTDGSLEKVFESTRLASDFMKTKNETFRKAIKLSPTGYHKGFIFRHSATE